MKSFDRILREALAELEDRGGDVEAVLSRHPEHSERLRAHFELWSELAGLETGEPRDEGFQRGLQQLSLAVRRERQGGIDIMQNLWQRAGFGLRAVGAVAVVAAIALGITFLSGNLRVELGSEASADHTAACLDSVLGNLADPQDGHFTVDDLIAARDAARTQNTDPRYDRDGDGDVDIDDLMVYIQELKACFGSSIPAPPAP